MPRKTIKEIKRDRYDAGCELAYEDYAEHGLTFTQMREKGLKKLRASMRLGYLDTINDIRTYGEA